jgi:hypothetical protein
MTDFARRGTAAALLALSIVAASASAAIAGQPPSPAAPAVRPAPAAPQSVLPPAPAVRIVTSTDADQTREALQELLGRYSPSVGRVLALDPTLLQSQAYLEPYPELVAFLQQHPEVARNSDYYLEHLTPYYNARPTGQAAALRMWENLFQFIGAFLVFAVVTSTLVWLIKTLVDYRRWYRLSKVQTEAHNKLLDRFTANDELLAYIATPSGKRFLESAPIMLDTSSASIGTPLKRILWAIEIGLVMASGGGGLLFARPFVPAEAGQMLSVLGIFAIAIGSGFVLAAASSYLISRQLGVLPHAASRQAGDIDAQPGA